MNSRKTSKPITTSVPSFAIRFHANGEELEELYPSEEEEKSDKSLAEEKCPESSASGECNKPESSPVRDYLNKFGKRSSSIDGGINEANPSDPWRLFSEFKGKLTKTVEEKFSEIKSKENSPKHKSYSKENQNRISVSDSEDQSMSCSGVEDIGFSSDDEEQRVKYSKASVQFDVKMSSLSTVIEKDAKNVEDEVESGVEAYEDLTTTTNLQSDMVMLIAPTGFVDKRRSSNINPEISYSFKLRKWLSISMVLISFLLIYPIPNFLLGFLFGAGLTISISLLYYKLIIKPTLNDELKASQYLFKNNSPLVQTKPGMPIIEIPAVKEYRPVTKFEGWINEFPEPYDPSTYHISRTQTVYLKLEGSVMRVLHTRAKIPKRAMWNETKHKVAFTHQRVYNLKGSQVVLLPNGLIHKRIWSKKYPICIVLNKETMHLDINVQKRNKEDEQEHDESKQLINVDNEIYADPMIDNTDETNGTEDEKDNVTESYSDVFYEDDKDEISIADDWDTLGCSDDNSTNTETKIYLFGRTCRDKEDWFRRLVNASRNDSPECEKRNEDEISVVSNVTDSNSELIESCELFIKSKKRTSEENTEADYLRYMSQFNINNHQVKINRTPPHSPDHPKRKPFFRKRKDSHSDDEDEKEDKKEVNEISDSILWMNAIVGRILYDVFNHNVIINKIQQLFQRKLHTIKLPYFIEDIVVSDLSFGKSSPLIHHISGPSMDERGLWVYIDLTYEGLISTALVTKLNLMKLKEQAGKVENDTSVEGGSESYVRDSRSPMYYSDVEDSAESSSDEENSWLMASSDTLQEPSTPRSKKLLRMVDKIAASKYFQHATDNKYIKRAMEGVSRTELKLTLEMQYLYGTLALNIPSSPSDRIWIGFKDNPKLQLSAHPAFGERSLKFIHVTRWIEKKLSLEFQKFLVLPNMEDIALGVMNPTLPQ